MTLAAAVMPDKARAEDINSRLLSPCSVTFADMKTPFLKAVRLIQQVTQFLFLGPQVAFGGLMRSDDTGNALGHPNSGVLERGNLVGIVGKQAHATNLEVAEDLGGHLVVAQIRFKTEALVGFHGVGAAVLQLVGAQFVKQTDAAALLVLIDQQATSFFGDQVERQLQLRPAIAAQAVEDVAGEALRVDANEGRLGVGGNIAHPEHDTLLDFRPIGAFEAEDAKMA